MPLIGLVLNPNDTGAEVGELHRQLSELGAVIKPGELTAQEFGEDTTAAVRLFREQRGLPPGDTVDRSTARLMHAASAFASPGGVEALRAAVSQAAAAADVSDPQALYWLARMAALTRDYPLVQSFAGQIPDHPEVKTEIEPILELPDRQPHFPERLFPENFYTYRHDLYPLDLVQDIQRLVREVGEPPRHPRQAGVVNEEQGKILIQVAVTWLEAIKQWGLGNDYLNRRRYAAAVAAYDACQSAACDFFTRFHDIDLGNGVLTDRLTNLIKLICNDKERWTILRSNIIWRRGLLSLQELHAWDFPEPGDLSALLRPRSKDPSLSGGHIPEGPDYGLGFIQFYFQNPIPAVFETLLETPLVTIAFILAPLARAEANRASRQYEAAFRELRWVLDSIIIGRIFPTPQNPGPIRNILARLACEFIELPFARLLLAETLLDQADTEYKARTPATGPPAREVPEFQNLKAAQTYLAIKDEFSKNEPLYVTRVNAGRDSLVQQIQDRLGAKDTSSREFQLLGKNINIPTIDTLGSELPGLDRRAKAHEQLLTFAPLAGQNTMRETNPRVYAILLLAEARLEQLKAGFNYLGYLDSYVPPFRFQFLLERARYFTEHAKNAQRDYLNFLGNAEREDFQELSASQNVEMEKSNLRIETARVDLANVEIAAAQQSKELADLTRNNAIGRRDDYKEFDEFADGMDWLNRIGMGANVVGGIISGAKTGGTLGGIAGGLAAAGSAAQQEVQNQIADELRDFEKANLQRAIEEATKAAEVATTQLTATIASQVVVGLQRQAALLRHEFALQNLQFLRNRTLNTEQWYRLAASIRSVSETYFRYALELAFLAEQAYEFEADRRINVIRFDYDLSEVGDFLAADFLLRDLDTLEQDLLVTQRQRQQHIRYVLSMAREYPAALQELRETGQAIFSLRLEQLEKRFPGLFNLRIGAVDVLPVALMDSTRFSLELTHLGASQVRLKAQPDTPPGIPSVSPLNTNDLPVQAGEWLDDLQETYPVKLRISGPETAVFSGLTRQEASAIFAFATAGQRQAFEFLGAASAWQVDFTARENQVVPGTLADLLITLNLSGYHDPELRQAMDRAPRAKTATTRFFSSQSVFPDAFFEFNRSGRIVWNVSRDLLTLTDTLGALRNAAMLLIPSPGRLNYFGRLMSHYDVQIRILKSGRLKVLSPIPQVQFTNGVAANPLQLTAAATLPAGAQASWDFGDGSERQSGASLSHIYARSGRYTVTLRVIQNGSLFEFQAEVSVSRSQPDLLRPPVTAFPKLTRRTGANIPAEHTRVAGVARASAGDPVVAIWRIDGHPTQKGNNAIFDLTPGDYTVSFTAVRELTASVYSRQRHLPEKRFKFSGFHLASNRRFELDGTENTGIGSNPPANALSRHLFTGEAISPVDDWTVELSLDDNPFLCSVSATDVGQIDLSEIQDAILALEYETTPKS